MTKPKVKPKCACGKAMRNIYFMDTINGKRKIVTIADVYHCKYCTITMSIETTEI